MKEKIYSKLDEILVPGALRSLIQMNLVRNVEFQDGKADIQIASTALEPAIQDWLKGAISDAVGKMEGVKEVNVSFIALKPPEINKIGKVIAVMSGKGGVGKSLVSGLTALALKRIGFEVGILDADITGPSIPRMFGLKGKPAGNETGLLPATSRLGIEVMSINLLLENEDDAVIWRGPLIAGAITQFWNEVVWGKLDYLIVDLPPGTADAPLTTLQTLPVSGIIIVFTPQELTAMVVRKAVKMADKMQKPIIGVIENMSYLFVPEINKKIELFGKSHAGEMAAVAGAPLLAQIPIDPKLARLCDEGEIEIYNGEVINILKESLGKVLKNP